MEENNMNYKFSSVFAWSNSTGEFIFSKNFKEFMIKCLVWIEYLKWDLILGMNQFDWLKQWDFKFSKKL